MSHDHAGLVRVAAAGGIDVNGYSPFRSFEDWKGVVVDDARWRLVLDQVGELRHEPGDLSWLEGPLRAAAYQSGAIEDLHPGDRGLTMTLIDASAEWHAAVRVSTDGGGPEVVDFIEAGVESLHMALDVATNWRPLSESWIRQIHEIACRPQKTYRVQTAVGFQEQPLPTGAYKELDNHVLLPDGSYLWFAPAADVPHEMQRLVAETSGVDFARAHSVLQAAFVHHALTHVHPFADGNGRVARVLASVYLLRAVSLPFFLFADRKPRYLDSLSAADRGEHQVFVAEVLAATEDLASLLVERQRATRPLDGGSVDLAEWRLRFDQAAAFARAVESGVERALRRHRIRPEAVGSSPLAAMADYSARMMGHVVRAGDLPTIPGVERSLELTVGSRSVIEILDLGFDLLSPAVRPFNVRARTGGLLFEARADEAWPAAGAAFELRLDAWLDQVVARMAVQVSQSMEGRRNSAP